MTKVEILRGMRALVEVGWCRYAMFQDRRGMLVSHGVYCQELASGGRPRCCVAGAYEAATAAEPRADKATFRELAPILRATRPVGLPDREPSEINDMMYCKGDVVAWLDRAITLAEGGEWRSNG